MCETTCNPATPVDVRAGIKEKLRPLNTQELFEYAVKISLENEELRAKSSYQERELERMASDREKAYLNGKIEGLMYAARCNGMSGGEVR